VLARLEVVEEGARRDIGSLADLLDLRAADPALLEQLDRGVEQRLAVAAAPLLEAIERLGGGRRAQGGSGSRGAAILDLFCGRVQHCV